MDISKSVEGDGVYTAVIQHLMTFSDSSDASTEVCSFAVGVGLVRDWTSYPRVVAVIQNRASERNALFLFNAVRRTKDQYEDLKISEIIALDQSFRCEPAQLETYEEDPSVVNLRISGFRLTRLYKLIRGTVVQTKSSQQSPLENLSSSTLDNPNEDRNIRNASKLYTCRLVLAFNNTTEAIKFRQHTCQSAKLCSPIIRTDYNEENGFECGEDVLADSQIVLDDLSKNYSWLLKYSSGAIQNHPFRRVDTVNAQPSPPLIVPELSPSLSSSTESTDSNLPLPPSSHKRTFSMDGMLDDSTHQLQKPASSLPLFYSASKLDHVNTNNSSASNRPNIQIDRQIHSHQSKPSISHLTSSHSCSEISSKSYGSKNKTDLEDYQFRTRLARADVFIREELLKRCDEYCTFEKIQVFVGTWNVNGRQDSSVNLDDWLRFPETDPPADIYIFGFQELDLSLGSVALNKTNPAALEGRWTAQIESALGGLLAPRQQSSGLKTRSRPVSSASSYAEKWSKHTGGGYQRIRRVRLAGILMVAYISRRLFRRASPSEMDVQLVPTGVLNMMGNKGAVGLRLTLFNTGLCFINCHLAAGEANLVRRNQDFQEIKRKMIFGRRTDINNPNYVEQLGVFDHDIIFVFGDLNYRINGLDSSAVRQMIIQKDYDHILAFDELLKQLTSHRTFGQFSEHPITFAPTYKFDTNTNIYDTSDKFRIPSYCDRILWRGKNCYPCIYRSHSSFVMSDHKPVSCCFNIELRRVNIKLFERTYEAVVRSQDLIYNLSLPQADLDSQDFDFGPVRFYQVCQRTLTLRNIGRTGLQYQFLRDGIANIPSWLTISPDMMRVEKDVTVEINIEIFIKPEMVYELNSGTCELSTIVILRLIGGKDYFISISGQFVATSFGLPLPLLLQLDSVPIAWIPTDELRDKIKSTSTRDWKEAEPSIIETTEQPPFLVPKELFRLVDFITKHIDTPELFRQSGQYNDVETIRDMLDTTLPNVEFPDNVSVHGVVFCLLIFLNTLPEPLIPHKFQARCLEGCDNLSTSVKALTSLPIDHQNVFFYLVAFLRRCLSMNEQNGTDVELLATTFGDVVFRDTPCPNKPTQRKNTRSVTSPNTRLENTAMFMTQFLDNDPSTYFTSNLARGGVRNVP